MTLVASLLFGIAFAASVAVIWLTIDNAMPRIAEIVEMEFAPVVHSERRIFFGEVKARRSAEVIAFPQFSRNEQGVRLAA